MSPLNSPPTDSADRRGPLFCLLAMVLTAMAAGMGWGIRGQYGHESGAMIAGTLASLTLVLFFADRGTSLAVARAAALATVGIGIGGTMTYGQTIGLTQDAELVGNWSAWRWGMLGLFIKGGVWIGFFGAFLGMGLGGRRYRPGEMLLVLSALLGLVFLGIWLINSPYELSQKILPRIYFSATWELFPDKPDLRPRREVWGGLLTAWLGLTLYTGLVRRDRLAWRLAACGFVAGGLGFSGGQCLQSYHSWSAEAFQTGWLSGFPVLQTVNWWNMMETGFGCVFGSIMALSLWLNRRLIAVESVDDDVTLCPTTETGLCALHLVLLLTAEFLTIPAGVDGRPLPFSLYIDLGLIMCFLPMIGISGGRFWPYLQLLIVVAAPIMGKQLRNLCYSESPSVSLSVGWLCYVMIPTALLLVLAAWLIAKSMSGQRSRTFAAAALLATTWLYFGLNTAFFEFAWPWKPVTEWTGRTPSQLIFSVCAVSLTLASIVALKQQQRRAHSDNL